jgi:hypothetical protein
VSFCAWDNVQTIPRVGALNYSEARAARKQLKRRRRLLELRGQQQELNLHFAEAVEKTQQSGLTPGQVSKRWFLHSCNSSRPSQLADALAALSEVRARRREVSSLSFCWAQPSVLLLLCSG